MHALLQIFEWVKEHGGEPIIPFSGILEAKIFDMPDDEKATYLKEVLLLPSSSPFYMQWQAPFCCQSKRPGQCLWVSATCWDVTVTFTELNCSGDRNSRVNAALYVEAVSRGSLIQVPSPFNPQNLRAPAE